MTPIQKVHDRLADCAIKQSGDSGHQWVALCPGHDDNRHSLAIGERSDGVVVLKCYKGCETSTVLAAAGLTFSDLYPEKYKDSPPKQVVTVSLLAWDKRLPADFLKECGLANCDGGVEIPYFDQNKKRLVTKKRVALVAKEGSIWPKGEALVAYGLWRLKDAAEAGRLVLVEGESDCWTLWNHGIPALGLPGASASKCLTVELLANVRELYVWQEPGDGGADFVNGIARKLEEFKWDGVAKVLSSSATKDPNAMHQADPEGFKKRFNEIATAGKPMPAATNLKKKRRERTQTIIPDIIQTLEEQWKGRPVPAAGFFPMTDAGNAERMVFRHGSEIRYCDAWGKWLIWNGAYWEIDKNGTIMTRAIDTVRAIHAEAKTPDLATDKKTALENHALASEGFRNLKAMIQIASGLTVNGVTVPVEPETLDADPWLLNVRNGVVDLRSGKCRKPEQDDYITKQACVDYDEAAKCPTWLKFLDRIMGGSKELIRFLKLAVGYSLTATVSEKCFFFLYGTGDNGKSVFVETVESLLGDYQAKTTADTILDRGQANSSIPNDIARLKGVRFVSTAELPENRRLDEARVKDLTGRDTISARFLHREWFQFRPVFKLWMYGNHKPTIRGADDGIWRRVRLVPFKVSIPKAEQDEGLPAKLRAELPGILNWAIEGCQEWQKVGLPVPTEVRDATADYRSEMDVIADFIGERCTTGPGAKCLASDLYDDYRTWSKSNGEYAMSSRKFGLTLKARGFHPSRNAFARAWDGVELVSQAKTKNKDESKSNGQDEHNDTGRSGNGLEKYER